MHYLAIVGRELRRASRLPSMYALRAAYLALMIGIVLLVYYGSTRYSYGMNHATLSRVGRELYLAFCLSQMGLTLLLCPILLCGAIAEEAEDRTLEVLLTTPLGRGGIVLSKFASRMAYAGMLYFAGLPVMIASLYFGGVSPREVMISTALNVGMALWSGAIALLFSTVVKKGYAAALLSWIAICAWSIGVILAWGFVMGFRGRPPNLMFAMSPPIYQGLFSSGEMALAFGGADEWIVCLAVLLAWTLLALGLATRLVGWRLTLAAPREIAAQATPTRHTRVLGSLRRMAMLAGTTVALFLLAVLILPRGYVRGIHAAPTTFAVCLVTVAWGVCRVVQDFFFRGRAPLRVWDRAFLWKEVALRGSVAGRLTGTALTVGVALVGIGMMSSAHSARDDDEATAVLVMAFGAALLLVSVSGGASISHERESGLLELLLNTPVREHTLFDAKMLGALWQIAPLGLFYGLYSLSNVATGALARVDQLAAGTLVVAVAVVLHAGVGCACSLLARRTTTAILAAIGVPLVVYAGWPLVYLLIAETVLGHNPRDWHTAIALQPNPFFFFFGACVSSGSREVRNYPLGFETALWLHVGTGVTLLACVRWWAARNLRRLALSSGR